MKCPTRLLLGLGVMTLLSGCSYLDTFTGQTNNTVLPGQREDAIPGRASFPEKPDPNVGSVSKASDAGSSATGNTQPGCTTDDPGCKPPTTTNDTFKDPQ
jgi:hypothetical protein